MSRPPILVVALILFVLGGATALMISRAGDGDETDATHSEREEAFGPALTEAAPEAAPAPAPPVVGPLAPADSAAVEEAVRAYIAALNAHNGVALCARFQPLALDVSELPRPRGQDCAPSVTQSIGFRRPGGLPAWKHTRVSELDDVAVGKDSARVTASVVHTFADRDYPSLEDDVIYLVRNNNNWLLAKPSGTFYRAIGYPEPPLRALRPPGA